MNSYSFYDCECWCGYEYHAKIYFAVHTASAIIFLLLAGYRNSFRKEQNPLKNSTNHKIMACGNYKWFEFILSCGIALPEHRTFSQLKTEYCSSSYHFLFLENIIIYLNFWRTDCKSTTETWNETNFMLCTCILLHVSLWKSHKNDDYVCSPFPE